MRATSRWRFIWTADERTTSSACDHGQLLVRCSLPDGSRVRMTCITSFVGQPFWNAWRRRVVSVLMLKCPRRAPSS
jgi:hypothetical protein